ncbi:hypothetical protein KL919_005072 [Ogataea angusta]|nr:hypothetical protein KL943_004916 [Ogataea angusta]KAG7854790.1 hypothetical protein KL919_005072 [Ogataea angusta]
MDRRLPFPNYNEYQRPFVSAGEPNTGQPLPSLSTLGSLPTVSTAPTVSTTGISEESHSPRQIPMAQTHQDHLMSINKHVMKTLLQSRSGEGLPPQTPPEKPNLGRSRQEGPLEIPRFIPFPGYPIIPPGYVPVMMSPQGFLVPMQFSQTPVKDDEKNNENYTAPEYHSPRPGKVSKIAQLINSPTSEPQQLYGVGTAGPMAFPASPSLNSKDKLAAFQLCLVSQEYFSTLGPRLSEKEQDLIDELKAFEPEVTAQDIEKLRQEYVNQLNLVSNTKTIEKPFSKRSHRVNKILLGLERDMAEKRDYEVLRLKLYKDYRRKQIIDEYVGQTMEIYSALCLDYTTRLSKLKKFLLQQKQLLKREDAEFFNVATADSERLWRSTLSASAGEPQETAPPPKKKQKVELEQQKLSDNDSYSSSASVSGLRSSSRISKQSKEDARHKKRPHPVSKEPILDAMAPVSTEEQFQMVTNPNSRTYHTHVIGSSDSSIADQSDLKQLAEHFKTESTLAAVIKRKEEEAKGKKKNKVLRDLIMAHESQQAKNRGNGGQRPSTAELLSVHDSDTDMWNINYSLALVREYKLPLGLTQEEIDDDLAELGI